MIGHFCWNCYNFEDRRDIDNVTLCERCHNPGAPCEDFTANYEELSKKSLTDVKLRDSLCWNCYNFEDRKNIDGSMMCAKGHLLEGHCEDFSEMDLRYREISNNNRRGRVVIKAVLALENGYPTKFSYSLQNLVKNGK